jgi:hypothetical protein
MGLKRGGTSLVARIVQELGVHMGTRFPPPDKWNESGYCEDEDFVAVLDRLLNGAKVENGRLVKYDQVHWLNFTRLIEGRNAAHSEWGLKNFLLNFILPTFVQLCGDVPVRLLRVERPFAEAVASWQRKHHGNEARCLMEQAELLYNLDLVWARHSGPKFRVSYHELLESPHDTVLAVARWLDLPFRPEAVQLVRSDLHHVKARS